MPENSAFPFTMRDAGICVVTVFALLFPVSGLAQNSAVTPVPKEGGWEKFHQRFLARAKQGEIDVLFIGDSITQYWEDPERGKPVWDRAFAGYKVANFGINSDRLQHILWRIQNGELEGFTPKVIVLLAGTNNTKRNTTPEIIEGIKAITQEIKDRAPESKILLLGILPRGTNEDPRKSQVVEINRRLADMEDSQQVFYLDMGDSFLEADGSVSKNLMPDLLHPNRAGYEVMAEELRKPLLRLSENLDNP